MSKQIHVFVTGVPQIHLAALTGLSTADIDKALS